ncbi:phage holin, lambda family [Onishia taeanensis]|uniref:Phage holin, lambda family n=1 Tax=Onishia taeanensis TaxID=284577 RepID=A0A1G7N632_9GAMM|nr:phage holin family protein [Halomonas taeanensis]SDF69406.1 phage holin, lambda family [Halomonas taeanensis]
MTRRHKPSADMPTRDPNNWQRLIELCIAYAPNVLGALLTFAIALARGLQDGGPWRKALLGALVCTLLGIGLFPLFQALAVRYELPGSVAFAPCVFLAFLGTEWLRNKADDIYELIIGRWRP